MKKNALLYVFVLILGFKSFSQDGTLDVSFDLDGKLSFSHPDNLANAPSFHGVDVQNDGKILAVGTSKVIVRLNQDGSFDSTFDSDGKLLLNNMLDIYTVKALSNGKILVAGIGKTKFTITGIEYNCFGIIRLNSDGTLDNTFGINGYSAVTFNYQKKCEAYDMAVQADGKIVVVGNAEAVTPVGDDDGAIVRLNENGTLDNTFGTGGKITYNLTSYDYLYGVAIDSNNKIVAVGKNDPGTTAKDSVVLRLNSDGTFDSTFDTDGKLILAISTNVDYLNDVKIQSDGKIVVCGFALLSFSLPGEWLIARINTDGTLDTTFDSDGKVNFAFSAWGGDVAHELLLQNDGKIIIGGFGVPSTSPTFCLARLNFNGSLDTSFGTGGKITSVFSSNSHCRGLAFQPDGKIIAAGLYQNAGNFLAISRHLNNNALNVIKINKDEFRIYPNPSSGLLFIKTNSEYLGANVEVTNILGQKIKSIELNQLENQIQLDNGIFLLNVTKENQKFTYKIIVE